MPQVLEDESPPARGWFSFRPAPAAPRITDPAEVDRLYSHWQSRILVASTIGYALFYFVRKNLSVALPIMNQQLDIHLTSLGLFLTLHGVIYGISKFVNGFVADRANARIYMACGLFLSALANIVFGSVTAAVLMGIVWMVNGWFQGMGFPPCARLLTHWFEPKKLATKMSIWNTSHCIGGAGVLILCGYLVQISWRLCFFVPAVLALAGSVYLFLALRDTPESIGLPPVEREQGNLIPIEEETAREDFKTFLFQHVFNNKYIWIVSIANFFVYAIRYSVLDWGPTMLTEAKGITLVHASWMVAAFEVFGAMGTLVGGWVTDRFLGGRGMRACVVYMICCFGSVWALWKTPAHAPGACTVLLCLSGFFIYGPQCLIGIIAANLATKRAAATAVGLTGFFGYASTVLSGVGLGWLAQHYGWNSVFKLLLVTIAIGTVLFVLGWNAKAHGYDRKPS